MRVTREYYFLPEDRLKGEQAVEYIRSRMKNLLVSFSYVPISDVDQDRFLRYANTTNEKDTAAMTIGYIVSGIDSLDLLLFERNIENIMSNGSIIEIAEDGKIQDNESETTLSSPETIDWLLEKLTKFDVFKVGAVFGALALFLLITLAWWVFLILKPLL